jgi:isocitrate dehydrogenase (NAD+)
MSVEGTRRVANFAFDYAVRHKRKSVTSICKANIMKFTDGLWLRREVRMVRARRRCEP